MNITPSNLPPIRPSSPKGKEKVNPKKSHFPKEKKNPVSSRMEKIISEADGALEKKIPPGLKPKQIDTISKGNLGNPSALQIEGDTTQPSLSWLSPALKEKIQRMELELIKNKQQDTAQATQSPGPIFSAEPLGNSLNPVGILKKPIYLQKSSLNTAEYPSFPMVSNVLKNAVINATGSRIRKAHKQKELINLNNEFKRIYDNEGLNPKEKFEMANATFNDFKKNNFVEENDEGLSIDFNEGIMKLEAELLMVGPLKEEEIQKIPVRYSKDEIINQLRIQIESEAATPELADGIIEMIRTINKSDAYLTKEDFISLLDNIKRDASEMGKGKEKAIALMNLSVKLEGLTTRNVLQEYVSSYDVLVTLGNSPMVMQQLAKAEINPGYAVKLGNENKRELLAREVLVALGFQEFFHLKTGINLQNSTIKGHTANDALASSLIEGKVVAEDRPWINSWDDFQKAEFRLNNAIYEEKPEGEIQELQVARDVAAERLKDLGATVSIPMHILVSALLGGSDEHMSQYIIGADNELTNIDFSRHFPPAAYVKERGSSQHETNFIFRNIFLNHPLSSEPLPASVLKAINNWDLPAIEKKLRSMTADPALIQKFQEIHDDIAIREGLKKKGLSSEEVMAGRVAVTQLFAKYNVPLLEGETNTRNQILRLEEKFEEEKNKLQTVIFGQLHPQAADDVLLRISTLKEYVRNESNPSAYGAFSKMYPEILPFMDYLKHTYGQSEIGEEISMKVIQGETQLKSLENIINHAEKFLKNRFLLEKKPKTSEEIKRRELANDKLSGEIESMKKQLLIIRDKAHYREELALTR